MLSLEPQAAPTSASAVSHISGKGCPLRPFNFSAPVIPVKTSDATVGSKHNAGIATGSSARFEIHFIYPASGVYALFAC